MPTPLVNDALENVWCVQDPTKQVIFKPGRITPINGVFNNFDYAWDSIKLPDSTSTFHLYQIGQISPLLIDLFIANETWQLLSDACNTTFIVCDIYTLLGIQIPRTRTWYIVTENKNILIAVENNPTLNYDFNNDELFIRLYKNAFFDLSTIGPHDQILVGGGRMTSTATISALTTQINSVLNASYYTGGMYMFINGYKQPAINVSTVKVGDIAEFVYDSTIYKTADFKIATLPSFISTLDGVSKSLLHYSGNNDGFVDYIDNIDIFIIDITTQKGVYVNKNAINTLRMITHKDYSIVTSYLGTYFPIFVDSNGFVNINNLYVRLHIRYSGFEVAPIYESNQIKYLMKLSDSQFNQALIGTNSNVPAWKAAALEHSAYAEIMRSSYSHINQALAEYAYGYTKCNYLFANTPNAIVSGSVAVPPAFQSQATAFEYDTNGLLLGYYVMAVNSLTYSRVNSSCTTVEFVEGIASNSLDETYELVPTTIAPNNNYRYYVNVLNQDTEVTEWSDVSGSSFYSKAAGVSTWFPSNPLNIVNRLVRSDKKFLTYQTTMNPVDGLLIHQLTYTKVTSGGNVVTTLDIPMGELDVWINGHSLVEGVDYIYNFPTISIVSKAYLHTPPTLQTLTIRFTGFCDHQMHSTPISEVGYVYNGVLSVNETYDLHDQRVQRIAVGGRMYSPTAVTYIENTTSGGLTNGLPYSIRDVINPLNGLIKQDPYDFYYAGLAIEKTVSNYLTLALPEVLGSSTNPISGKYVLYSPFIGKIIYDLSTGVITNSALSGPYPDSFVLDLCSSYEYLLALDPIAVQNTPNLGYCTIQPHWLNTPIASGTNNYRFIMNVVRIYANGIVDISSLVTLDPGL